MTRPTNAQLTQQIQNLESQIHEQQEVARRANDKLNGAVRELDEVRDQSEGMAKRIEFLNNEINAYQAMVSRLKIIIKSRLLITRTIHSTEETVSLETALNVIQHRMTQTNDELANDYANSILGFDDE